MRVGERGGERSIVSLQAINFVQNSLEKFRNFWRVWFERKKSSAYLISFLPSFFVVLQKSILAFLWDERHPQIAAATIFTPKERGGLGLLHPPSQCHAIKGWWLTHMSSPTPSSWLPLAKHFLRVRYVSPG